MSGTHEWKPGQRTSDADPSHDPSHEPSHDPAAAAEARRQRRLERRARRRDRLADASVPLRKIIPNLITIAAMCSGVASLYFSSKFDPATLNGEDTNLKRAVAAIGMAALLDALDGRAARLLKATSRFGETLDSLSDFVSFGIAPAVLLYRWSQGATTVWGVNLDGLLLMTLASFTVCSAVRLARFTAMQRKKKVGSKPTPFFTGLPTPAAAGAALIPPMLMLSDFAVRTPVLAVIAWMLFVAAFMVSRIPMYSGKGIRVPRRWVIPIMVAIALVVASFAHDAWLTMSGISFAYVLTLVLSVRAHKKWTAAYPDGPKTGPAPAPGSPKTRVGMMPGAENTSGEVADSIPFKPNP